MQHILTIELTIENEEITISRLYGIPLVGFSSERRKLFIIELQSFFSSQRRDDPQRLLHPGGIRPDLVIAYSRKDSDTCAFYRFNLLIENFPVFALEPSEYEIAGHDEKIRFSSDDVTDNRLARSGIGYMLSKPLVLSGP